MITKNCEKCSKEFAFYPYDIKERKFCTQSCYWQAKKGSTGYWLGKQRLDMQEKNNPKWLGNKVSYRGLHTWVRKYKNKTNVCEKCKKNKKTDWANKSHKYKRELTDWLELCRKCHIDYDKDVKGIATKIYGNLNEYR